MASGNPWGAVMAGAGQAIIAGADYHAAQKRADILKHLIERRQFQQGQIDDRTNRFVSQMRDSTPETERANATAEFLSAIKANQANVNPGTARGAVSDREAAELASLDADLAGYGREEADIEAGIAAPMRQRLEEGLAHGRLRTDVDLMKRRIESTDYLGQLRLARARANPWMTVLGEGLKAAGGAVASGAGGGTSSFGNAGAGSGYSAAAQRAGRGNYVYGGPRGN